jgi:hypothetical protein
MNISEVNITEKAKNKIKKIAQNKMPYKAKEYTAKDWTNDFIQTNGHIHCDFGMNNLKNILRGRNTSAI